MRTKNILIFALGGIALVLLIVLAIWLLKPQIQDMRAGDLIRKGESDFLAGDTEAAYLSGKSAWLINPGDAETAAFLFEVTQEVRPQESISWFLEMERLGHLTPEATEHAVYLACLSNRRTVAEEWLLELERTEPGSARSLRVRAVFEGLFGKINRFVEWFSNVSNDSLSIVLAEPISEKILARLNVDQFAPIPETILARKIVSQKEGQLLGFILQLAAHPGLSSEQWTQLWSIVSNQQGLSVDEKLKFLAASALSPNKSDETLLAAYDALENLDSGNVLIQAGFLFRVGEMSRGVELIENPSFDLPSDQREQLLIQGYSILEDSVKLRNAVGSARSLSKAMQSAWMARASMMEGSQESADRFFDLAVSQSTSADWQNFVQMLLAWKQEAKACELFRRLLDQPQGRQFGASGLIQVGLQTGNEAAIRDGLRKVAFDAPSSIAGGIASCYSAWLFNERIEPAIAWLEDLVRSQPQSEYMVILTALYQLDGRDALVSVLYPSVKQCDLKNMMRFKIMRGWLNLELADPDAISIPAELTADRPELLKEELEILHRLEAAKNTPASAG